MKKYGWWIALGVVIAVLAVRFVMNNMHQVDEWLLSMPSVGWIVLPAVALFVAWLAGRKA